MAETLLLDDIVFEQRNKNYGAYALRRTYDKHVNTAIALSLALFLTCISLPTIIKLIKSPQVVKPVTPRKTPYNKLEQPPSLTPNLPPPPQVPVAPRKPAIQYVAPQVTAEDIPDEEVMPTMDEIRQVDTGAETIDGDASITFDVPATNEIIEAEPKQDKTIYTFVEQAPEFPGGQEALLAFLGKHIKYPSIAVRNEVQGTVFVQFIVSQNGNIDNVEVVKGISQECDAEAIRVVRLMPEWKPGKQNGRAVNVKYVLPVRFKLAE